MRLAIGAKNVLKGILGLYKWRTYAYQDDLFGWVLVFITPKRIFPQNLT
jgi:hypothetical protein